MAHHNAMVWKMGSVWLLTISTVSCGPYVTIATNPSSPSACGSKSLGCGNLSCMRVHSVMAAGIVSRTQNDLTRCFSHSVLSFERRLLPYGNWQVPGMLQSGRTYTHVPATQKPVCLLRMSEDGQSCYTVPSQLLFGMH